MSRGFGCFLSTFLTTHEWSMLSQWVLSLGLKFDSIQVSGWRLGLDSVTFRTFRIPSDTTDFKETYNLLQKLWDMWCNFTQFERRSAPPPVQFWADKNLMSGCKTPPTLKRLGKNLCEIYMYIVNVYCQRLYIYWSEKIRFEILRFWTFLKSQCLQIQAFIQGTASEVHRSLRRARGVVVEEAYDLVEPAVLS
jgi:hypothetical protein